MTGALFLLLWAVTGIFLLYLLLDGLLLEERLAYGSTLGLAANALVSLLLAAAIGFGTQQLLLSSLLFALLVAIAMVATSSRILRCVRDDLSSLRDRYRSGELWWLLVLLLLTTPVLTNLFLNSWRRLPAGWFAGHIYIWGDMPIHAGLAQSLVARGSIPPHNTYYSGTRLTYPFVADFLSACLIRLGWSLETAIVGPGVLLGLVTVISIYCFATRVGGRGSAGALAVILILLSGGGGFVLFLAEIERTGQFWHTLLNLPGFYTRASEYRINLVNITLAFLVPQRPFLLALPLAMLVFTLLYRFGFEGRAKLLFVAGAVTAMLPLIHPHTLLAILFVSTTLFTMWFIQALFRRRRELLRPLLTGIIAFNLPLVLASPQGVLLLGGGTPSESKFSLDLGWNRQANGAFVWYWFKNTGVFLPLIAVALMSHRVVPSAVRQFYLPFALLFVLPTFVALKPFDCCNKKLLVYWYIGSAILVAMLLVATYRSARGFVRGLIVCLAFLLTFSGGLDVLRASFPSQVRIQAFNNDDIELAEEIVRRTDPDAVFLTGTNAHHPVSDLAGRQVVLGPPFLMVSWGVNYGNRKEDLSEVYSGGPDAPELLRKYGVSYVVIGNPERRQYKVNEPYFKARYRSVITAGRYTVYDVRDEAATR